MQTKVSQVFALQYGQLWTDTMHIRVLYFSSGVNVKYLIFNRLHLISEWNLTIHTNEEDMSFNVSLRFLLNLFSWFLVVWHYNVSTLAPLGETLSWWTFHMAFSLKGVVTLPFQLKEVFVIGFFLLTIFYSYTLSRCHEAILPARAFQSEFQRSLGKKSNKKIILET